ncbi:MAG: TonB-dependent receptor [Acidobacteria bacterium]|nr:TonB-dependent receptor [Acidobacteriota bacterium]
MSWGRCFLFALGSILLSAAIAHASVTASISGTVKDASGASVAGATVTALNTETGISQTQSTNAQGYYSFQALTLGHYQIQIQQAGFRGFLARDLVLDVNSALVVDATLQLGEVKETVEVSSESLHVETASSQLGEVIGGNEMTAVPLVTRSYTDLLALQPGVVSQASGMTGAYAGTFNSAGFAVPQVSGDLNGGALSVNGQREANNGFLLNGGIVRENGYGGTTAVPNLDSIAEFRILTNNYDAEYGNYSGGQINVITKSGTNHIHGNAFEFLRNTNLDARGYLDPLRGAYHQNQFGGTIGGPVKKDKIFFFADYQGNRKVQGVSSPPNGVPSTAELSGDFSAVANSFLGKTVQSPTWASQLSRQLGYPVSLTEAYYKPGCTSPTVCVFPDAKIPSSAFSLPAQKLLAGNFIPSTPTGGSLFSTSFPLRLRDDKTSGRIDANTGAGLVSVYYLFDNYTLSNPYPNANVPGYDAAGTGRTQVVNLGVTKTLGSTSVNEARVQATRYNNSFNQPKGGAGHTLASLGFTTGGNGIIPLAPAIEGVPELDFNQLGMIVGVPSRPNRLIENNFQVLDNFSKVTGTHTLKFGGNFHYNQLVEQLDNVLNGNFVFNGTETGIDFADFLIGAPTNYVQGQAEPSNGRARYFGLYGQDSWRARSNLTLNYGLRWDVSTPWWEEHNQIQTIVPGLQSVVFPGSPRGWVFPGDPGIPRALAPTRYNNFGPRLGLAYSPSGGGKLFGGPGHTSIRAGYGVFFTAFEGATNFNEIGDAPFGFFWVGTNPQFATPWLDRTDTGLQGMTGQKFPVAFPPLNVGPNNPDNNVNWSLLTPIGSSPGFYYKNRLPYAENYELSVQRQLGPKDLLTLSYVGNQAHRLLVTQESNPGNPALCLSLSQPSDVLFKSPTCGPNGENNTYTAANGQVIQGTRLPIFGPNFQSNGWFITSGQSSYNSLQLNYRHTSGRLQILTGYTYSKSLDNSSGYGEQVNPFDPRQSIALSAFDSTHNFVVSYNYELPIDKIAANRLTRGWAVSGITRFATGLPVTLIETDDNSLLGTQFTGPIPLGIDVPDYSGGSVHINDPRKARTYFDIAGFSPEPLGQLGNARRRFFHGPGINNWDMALLKDTKLTENTNLEFRAEFFNVFNHAQFGVIDGNVNSPTFGQVKTALAPRIAQLSLKLNF